MSKQISLSMFGFSVSILALAAVVLVPSRLNAQTPHMMVHRVIMPTVIMSAISAPPIVTVKLGTDNSAGTPAMRPRVVHVDLSFVPDPSAANTMRTADSALVIGPGTAH